MIAEDWFTPFQLRLLNRRARTYFDKKEDREDFLQTAYLISFENWIERGRPLFKGKPDSYAAEYIALSARKEVLLKQKATDSNLRERHIFLKEDRLDHFDKSVSYKSLGKMLDRCPLPNSKDQVGVTKFKFIAPNGAAVLFDYNELQQMTGFTRDSIGRKRSKGRPIKAYLFREKLYFNLIDIQNEHKITEATARWNAKKFTFAFVSDQKEAS